jgi:hypothetical protein
MKLVSLNLMVIVPASLLFSRGLSTGFMLERMAGAQAASAPIAFDGKQPSYAA